MATADGGAAGGGGSDSPPASGDIDSDLLDIGSLQLVQEADEESWLLDTAQGDHRYANHSNFYLVLNTLQRPLGLATLVGFTDQGP